LVAYKSVKDFKGKKVYVTIFCGTINFSCVALLYCSKFSATSLQPLARTSKGDSCMLIAAPNVQESDGACCATGNNVGKH